MSSSSNQNDVVCSICLNPMLQGEALFTSTCNHQFHFDCIIKSVQSQNNECPLCRLKMDSLINIVTPVVPPTPVVMEVEIPMEDPVDEDRTRTLSEVRASRIVSSPRLIETKTTLEVGGVVSTEEKDIYGLLTLRAPASSDGENAILRVPLDLVCIVDRSGSMNGNKMSLVKQTLSYIVTQLESTDRLSIVSFNDTAYPVSGLMMMNEQGKQTLENRIHSHEKLNPSGSTSIGRGLKMGIDVLNKRQTKNSLSSIFLLTDGQDIEVISYTDIMSAIPPSTTCHTYGFGSDHRVSVLSQIAEIGSGTFTYIDELKSVGDSLSHTLGSLFSCIAQNIEVKIELENGYSVAKVHSTFPTSAIPSSCVTIKIHDLNEDEKRNLVFEIHVPTVNEEDAENTQIGTASVKYIDPSSQKMLSSELTPLRLIRSNVIDDKTLLEVNYDLDVQRNRINAAKGMKEAVAYVEQRSMDQATAVLQAVIDKINASVSSQDTLCQSLIEDLNTSIKKFEHDKQKFMAYMTNMSMQQCSERGTYTSPHFSSSNAYITSSNRAQRANFQNYSS